MSASQPLVTMKGRKDGLVLVMDEMCAYDALIDELKEKLSVNRHFYKEGPMISVKVQTGNRYISESQRSELVAVIRSYDHLQVESIESNVMTSEEFENKRIRERLTPITRIVRSGQVLSVEGNLLLIGDVNPGGTVSATGNVYILGALRGIACAGSSENESRSVIVASIMKPTQLRIGGRISRTEEEPMDELKNDHILECAYADPSLDKIVIDRLQTVLKRIDLPVLFAQP
ncbi:septum site-determining protein MinC [Sporolactobacillus shoreae]|uniref:Probable septum site-determining protein MinC n=1 Tax=Sporolactobacillus shoreae TaxID=1465501 RepID=A0A4Z0GSI3_9BACL|nr:septum site-determining protein MinC [Sporolactobacillus shoreae]TGA99487.1 septum site-determining protein MinC [Sporolactobacillus shoreae]